MANEIEELRTRYARFKPLTGVVVAELAAIEGTLQIQLPTQFREIAAFTDGVVLGGLAMLLVSSDTSDDYTVTAKTLELRRSVGLPGEYLVIAAEDESTVLMNCRAGGEVTWLDNQFVPALADGVAPGNLGAVVYRDFASFFGQLLDSEEHLSRQKPI